jgi:hypothetical protein
MVVNKKFLDANGVQYLWSKVSLQDYPNNDTLVAVIEAIDETKADKDYVQQEIALALANAKAEPAENDIPKVFIDGIIPTTKDDVLAELTYISKTLSFHSYIEIKC